MTKTLKRIEARQLRQEGWSVKRIADYLGIAKGSVSTWCRDIVLTEEQKEAMYEREEVKEAQLRGSQTNKVMHREKRLGYQAEGRAKAREGDALHLAGCMLYWAEGKKSRVDIGFVNSDADMIILFMRFLRESLHVADENIRARFNCYLNENLTADEVERYWLDLLGLKSTNLTKSRFNAQPISSQQKGRKLMYGVCEVSVSSVRHVQHVYGAIQEYAKIERPEWLD